MSKRIHFLIDVLEDKNDETLWELTTLTLKQKPQAKFRIKRDALLNILAQAQKVEV